MHTDTEAITYHQIQPLVQSAEQTGTNLVCVFACPVSGKTAGSRVDIVKANGSIATKAKAKLRASVLQSATRSVGRTLRSVLGNDVVGRLAGELVNDQGKAMAKQGGFGAAELERAKLAAFEQVQAQFAWHHGRACFVHRSVFDDAPTKVS